MPAEVWESRFRRLARISRIEAGLKMALNIPNDSARGAALTDLTDDLYSLLIYVPVRLYIVRVLRMKTWVFRNHHGLAGTKLVD